MVEKPKAIVRKIECSSCATESIKLEIILSFRRARIFLCRIKNLCANITTFSTHSLEGLDGWVVRFVNSLSVMTAITRLICPSSRTRRH